MGLMGRFTTIVKAKASKALDKAEDPRETLDYSYEKQLEMLQKVRRGVAEVATSKKRIELQAAKLEQSVTKLDGQARSALQQGREDLARVALERKGGVQAQLRDLDAQRDQLQGEQDKLVLAEQRLTAKVEAFRTRKETIKAQYTAAEAQTRIGEAVTGVSEEMADVGLAIERAENKTETMRARAGAIDELIASGALTDITDGKDDIDRQLEQLSAGAGVDDELASLKAELGTGGTPRGAIGSGGEGEKA
jgi:phage shock protein A